MVWKYLNFGNIWNCYWRIWTRVRLQKSAQPIAFTTQLSSILFLNTKKNICGGYGLFCCLWHLWLITNFRDDHDRFGMNIQVDQRDVFTQLTDYAKRFKWNNPSKPHSIIVPMLHGTSTTIAWKIAQTGFANTSTRDLGFYGSGIYFTSSLRCETCFRAIL